MISLRMYKHDHTKLMVLAKEALRLTLRFVVLGILRFVVRRPGCPAGQSMSEAWAQLLDGGSTNSCSDSSTSDTWMHVARVTRE